MCQLKNIIPYFTCLDSQTTIQSERTQSKRQFKLDKMQTHFMVNQSSKQKSLQLINKILSVPTNNISSNDLYPKLVKFYINELIENVGYTGKGNWNKPNRKPKPWWSSELSKLWNDVRLAERQFLLAKKNNNNISIILDKRNYYQYAVKLFDKYYIKSKRKYYCERHNQIAETETKNPKDFRKIIKNLGPRKTLKISMEFEIGNVVVNDVTSVLSKWRSDFECLYNKSKLKYNTLNEVLFFKTQMVNQIFL